MIKPRKYVWKDLLALSPLINRNQIILRRFMRLTVGNKAFRIFPEYNSLNHLD